jgi:hypothetical protein
VAAYALEKLPRVAAALSSGLLHLDKVVELARYATPETEEKLVEWARTATPGQIKNQADKARAEVAEAKETYESRYLRKWWTEDGSALHLEGLLPAADGMRFEKAIDRLARSLPDLPAEEDGTTLDYGTAMDQKRADALGMMASARIAEDQDSDRATVVMFGSVEELGSDVPQCEAEGGQVLHPDVAQLLCCDALVQPVMTGKNGDVGVGRKTRVISPSLRRLVFKRDNWTCVFPGCEEKRFLHAHHMTPWPAGGPTQLKHLITECSRHHDFIHLEGWGVKLGPDDKPIFFRPSGRVYDPTPPGAGERFEEQVSREEAAAPSREPGPSERTIGLENFRLKEISTGFADDLYEVAKHLAGV